MRLHYSLSGWEAGYDEVARSEPKRRETTAKGWPRRGAKHNQRGYEKDDDQGRADAAGGQGTGEEGE